MNEANTKKLRDEFPRLYRLEKDLGVHDGWFGLVYDLSEAIEVGAAKAGIDPFSDEWPCASQVKSKFGTLRFYFQGIGVETIHSLVAEAEEKSAVTCELCGQEGHSCVMPGVMTLCEKCFSNIEDYKKQNHIFG